MNATKKVIALGLGLSLSAAAAVACAVPASAATAAPAPTSSTAEGTTSESEGLISIADLERRAGQPLGVSVGTDDSGGVSFDFLPQSLEGNVNLVWTSDLNQGYLQDPAGSDEVTPSTGVTPTSAAPTPN
ncbi:hypothetical protein [Microbacterium rhizomatis]|uniref:Uncharacterized protein n=1 Tax=Microbacterium rhizomatis TaxID=1631477 RepID=A0A5J5J4X8_9MICO|nr:hypothetical protein [Microbacterium rhizomatis]KAA9111092.1 hypothetical protein F6B43_05645 [Microbacterium rhizomatis]